MCSYPLQHHHHTAYSTAIPTPSKFLTLNVEPQPRFSDEKIGFLKHDDCSLISRRVMGKKEVMRINGYNIIGDSVSGAALSQKLSLFRGIVSYWWTTHEHLSEIHKPLWKQALRVKYAFINKKSLSPLNNPALSVLAQGQNRVPTHHFQYLSVLRRCAQ